MGILDQLRWVAGRVTGRIIASNSQASLYDSDLQVISITPQRSEEDYYSQRGLNIGRRILTNLGKFAVSSAVDVTLNTVSGGNQVHKGVKEEGPKAGHAQSDFKKPRRLAIMVEEMQAKVETMEEERNNATQLQSTHCVKPLDNLKELLAEPSDELTPQKADRRKVFIRSRL